MKRPTELVRSSPVVLLPVPQAIRPVESVQEATLLRAKHTLLPSVEFEGTDVREALRLLFRKALIGGTVAPEVRGPVTLSLRNVDWETALQNVTREVDATYRVRNGWVEVVPREDCVLPRPPAPPSPIVGAYDALARAVAMGSGKGLGKLVDPAFEWRNATAARSGEPARRALVETTRMYRELRVESVDPKWKDHGSFEETIVAYRRPHAPALYFRDFWQESDGGLRLVAREETAAHGGTAQTRSFRNVPLSQVLHAMFDDEPVSWKLGPALDCPVTIELGKETFETSLQRLTRDFGLTYRIEGGVYEIVAREGAGQAPPEDPSNIPVPFIEFDRTDVRVALSWLFQKVHTDYRFDPKVKGLITVSLRNVTFETALQNIARQADATYRIENGVYEVEPREADKPLPALKDRREIDRVYQAFRVDPKPARFLPSFQFDPGDGPEASGQIAHDAFLQRFRSRPKYKILFSEKLAEERGVPVRGGLLIEYDLGPNQGVEDFWDVWVRRPGTPWRLALSRISYPGL